MPLNVPLSLSFRLLLPLTLCSATALCQAPRVPGAITLIDPLPTGMRVHTANGFVEQIDALRDDVLRVRLAASGSLPEDASWAVLPEARTARARVTATSDGFRTAKLQVRIAHDDVQITVLDSAGNVIQADALPAVFTGNSFRITRRSPADEHYFGLGDKTGPSDRRGHAFTLWNTDAYRFQESTDPIYKSIPFFLSFRSGQAVGLLFDNTWRPSFDFGKETPGQYSFGSVNGPCDYYIFLGPEPRGVVETYAWLTGKPPLPPRWALGYQQSKYTYTPESRLMEIATRLRAEKIPTDVLWLDIDFQDRNRPFTIDEKTFPKMGDALAKLAALHFHTVAITDLHIAAAPGQGYAPYDSGKVGNHFVHSADGKVYVGDVWPGPAVFPDFTQASTRDWWGTLYDRFVTLGFAGFWNDMNEPSVFNVPTGTMPEDNVHRIAEPGFATRTATHAEIHNVFGMENSRATYDGLRKLSPNERPFVMTRATYAGGQRYAVTWTGDDSATWNHLRMTAPMLKSLGLSGFSFAGADVGGFAGSSTPELLTRWLEVAAFHPIDRDHAEKVKRDQEPWVDGPEQEAVRRHFIETRYRLMPYLYTVAEETARTGLPMMRPLFLDDPHAATDGHPLDIDLGIDQEFLLGHALLIAPSPFAESPDSYPVEFPSAAWYDFWTGAAVPRPVSTRPADSTAPKGPDELIQLHTNVTPKLEELPVYVRGGSILPMQPLTQSTDEIPDGPLTLRVYAPARNEPCAGTLYTDDGHSFDYQRGIYLRVSFTCAVNASGKLTLTVSKHQGSYPAWWRDIQVDAYGFALHTSSATIHDAGKGATITLE